MAKNIGYIIQPNATPTAAQAPYLVRLVPTGVANDADLVADLSAEMPVTEARYATIWREAIACAIPRLKAGETVDLGCFRLVPHIEKAMACEDSAFDPELNALVVAVYLTGELAAATEGLVPAKISSAALASLVKVSNVMDVATEAFSEIHGTDEFAVLGNGVTLDGEDEYVRALDAKTGEEIAVATVVRVSKGQRGFAKFETPLPAGRTTVEIGTHGLIADEQLHVFKKTVTVVAAKEPPEPRTVSVTTERCARDGSPNTLAVGSASEFVGENLDTVEAVTWREEAGPSGITGTVGREHWQANGDGTVLTLDETVPGEIKAATGADGIIAFVFTSHGGVPGSAQQSVKHGGLVFSA